MAARQDQPPCGRRWHSGITLVVPTPAQRNPGSGLYAGTVMHARLIEPFHRFRYRVFLLFADLDALSDLENSSPLFSWNRFNLLSFHDRDHGPRDGSSVRAFIDLHLRDAGVARPETVMILCLPRILGYAFNPITLYYCYGVDGDVSAMVYEVRNTFGEAHTYVAPVRPNEWHGPLLRQERGKKFHVSPFLDMDKRYRFRVHPPGADLRFRILETDVSGPVLSATQNGSWHTLNTRSIVILCLKMPLATLKVIAGIHWEALKLWRRGARYHHRGKPPEPVSHDDGPEAGAIQ